jgi:hypothetical protein
MIVFITRFYYTVYVRIALHIHLNEIILCLLAATTN